ncbi:disease resistance protein At4g27190-like [Lycium ferocissimum]|uniref:disease resistance protein At4g27190-like n=1 Tax=Lycium ferocissimum TaxID=112874 RepID=UPI0028154109|nr:disease resistance protein At4g27190-like [Lycium ferocissimum]
MSEPKAKKIVDTVIKQRNDGSKYEKSSHSAPPVTACIVSKKESDEDDGTSRQLILADIIKALNDEEINMIGICGPGGVGKTRMEKKVIAKVKGENLFDVVVFISVSQQFKLEELQDLIAKQLGLTFDEQDKNIKAVRLNTRLKKEYKILIILDDVWKELNLEEIGIPLGDDHKGCKIMLSSRSSEVCLSMVQSVENIFTIESLNDEESWDLFKRNAGDKVNDPAFNQIAQEISKECGGLPLGIITVAKALKQKEKKRWEIALKQLKSVLPINITGLGEVYKSLKLSYDYLENDEARKLYLHCCLFPEDYSIPLETLARRGMSLGMFAHINSLEDARDTVESLVDMLKNCFLLQKGEDDCSVIMHDALRDLAIYITSREQHIFGINHNLKVNQWPRDIHHEEVTCISVWSETTVKHPKTLNCPILEFLEIKAGGISYLHDDIFLSTKALKTIEVSGMQFSLMPSSIGLLTNLRMLGLFRCEMEDISSIGKLVNLEILSIRKSIFSVFPAELGKLEKLRLLDLYKCRFIETIEPGVLSSFLELEELDIRGCKAVEWEVENKVEQNKVENVSLAELQVMTSLTTLRIDISDRVIPKDVSLSGGLTGFFICIASYDNNRIPFESYDPECSKKVWCSSNAEHVVDWISNIVVDAEEVMLRESVTSHVIDLLAKKNFQHVKFLDVSFCKELLYLAKMSDYPSKAPSQYTNCFANLERLSIRNCEEIVYLLSMPLVSTTLPLLESLEIDTCKKLEQVFLLEEDNLSGGHGISQMDKVKFPRLETIKLRNLGALKGFCNGTHNIELPSLSSLRITNLPNIRGFFSSHNNQSANMHFLFREKHVEKLTFKHCKEMEQVFVVKDNEVDGADQSRIPDIQFPSLRQLTLHDLQALTNFCKGVNNIEFPSLRMIFDLNNINGFVIWRAIQWHEFHISHNAFFS